MGIRRDDDDFDEDDEDEEDNEEGEDGDEDESGFGEDIGDGYGEDTVDPLDAQERAEVGEDQQERSLDKEKKQTNDQTVEQPVKELNANDPATIAKKHPLSMSKHVEARCIFCHKKSIVRCKKNYIRTLCFSMLILTYKQYTPFYCVNPKCKMSFQRNFIQIAAGKAYQGKVIPINVLRFSET